MSSKRMKTVSWLQLASGWSGVRHLAMQGCACSIDVARNRRRTLVPLSYHPLPLFSMLESILQSCPTKDGFMHHVIYFFKEFGQRRLVLRTDRVRATKCLVSAHSGNANDGVNEGCSDCTKPVTNRSTLEVFSSWKTLALQKHHRPSLLHEVAERHFRMLVVRADHSSNVFALSRSEFFASKHARLRRASATATLYCCRHERGRMATPTRSQPQMRLLPHLADNLETELLEARSRDTYPFTDPKHMGKTTRRCSNTRRARNRWVRVIGGTTPIGGFSNATHEPRFERAFNDVLDADLSMIARLGRHVTRLF